MIVKAGSSRLTMIAASASRSRTARRASFPPGHPIDGEVTRGLGEPLSDVLGRLRHLCRLPRAGAHLRTAPDQADVSSGRSHHDAVGLGGCELRRKKTVHGDP